MGPTRLRHVNCIAVIMYVCIIMHNMIVEDEGVQVTSWANDDNEAGPSQGVAAANIQRGYLTMKPAASRYMATCAKWMLIFNSKMI